MFKKIFLVQWVVFSEIFHFDYRASLLVMLLILFSISALLTDVVIDLTAVRFGLVLYIYVCVWRLCCWNRLFCLMSSSQLVISSVSALVNTVCSVRPAECCWCWCHVVHIVGDQFQLCSARSVCLLAATQQLWAAGGNSANCLSSRSRSHRDVVRNTKLWSRAATNDYLNYWLTYYYCLINPWII